MYSYFTLLQICRGTKDPVYNERFAFSASKSSLSTRAVRCIAFTCERNSNTYLGQCEVKLSDTDLDQAFKSWLPIVDSRTVGDHFKLKNDLDAFLNVENFYYYK